MEFFEVNFVCYFNNADDLSKQTEVEYGLIRGGSSLEFFEVNLLCYFC